MCFRLSCKNTGVILYQAIHVSLVQACLATKHRRTAIYLSEMDDLSATLKRNTSEA